MTKLIRALAVAALLVAATLLHVVGTGGSSAAEILWRNALHVPAFLVLTILLYVALGPLIAGRHSLAITGLIAVSAALGGEFAQLVAYGQPSFADLARDLAGIGVGLLLLQVSLHPDPGGRSNRLVVLAAIVSATIVAATLAAAAWPIVARAGAMPVLLPFDDNWARAFWRPSNGSTVELVARPPDWPSTSPRIAQVSLARQSYSGIRVEPYADWRHFDVLSFTIATGDGRSHELTLRIDDAGHNLEYDDRLNLSFVATETATDLQVPLTELRDAPAGRAMDLSRIRNLMIFKADPDGTEILHLGDIRLETE